MPRPAGSSGAPPPGLVGLYALSMMEKEGRVHGYRVADRIAERTEGAWHPGPGAIYPSLQKLVARGWARARTQGRRREYEITPTGRKFLQQIRDRQSSSGSSRMDLAVLWAEVAGSEDLDSFLLMRLRRTLDSLTARLEGPAGGRPASRQLRAEVLRELARSAERLERSPALPLPALARRRAIVR